MELVAEGGLGLCAPCVESTGEVFVASPGNGEVLQLADAGDRKIFERVATCGSPSALACHGAGGLIGADPANQNVVRIQDGGAVDFISDNRGEKLVGPSGVHIAARSGAIFISDGGTFGDTGLASPRGRVLYFDPATQTLQTIATGLAYPTGLCTSPDGEVLYVCETAQNRILRFVQRPKNAWHGSVFHQFSGLFGPNCIDADGDGNLYIGRFDLCGMASSGVSVETTSANTWNPSPRHTPRHDLTDVAAESVVTILRANGEEYASFSVPGAEISGLCIDRPREQLYLTEASTGTLHRRPLVSLEDTAA
eukprot:TRINITY_DN4287_c0_g1_i2.p1 TRINITY_DN4287_c0_g1~~TRINITY_DN4287_c0_g1_i2.p1  ORF type:complete len:309 (+),score=94.55 TRINITY_DN4287_c0_g1_i2:60-986(+)